MRGMVAWWVLWLLGTGAAMAQERPPLSPTRDVAVTYRASGKLPGQPGGARQQDIRVAIQAGGALMRIEALGGAPGGGGGYVIVERARQRMTMVMPQDRRFVEMPANDAVARGFLLNDGMRFVRRGVETVAGLRCVVWDVTSQEGAGSACVTEDGVMLRGRGADGQGSIEAVAVRYAPLPATLFRPPADHRRIEIPTGVAPGGAAPGGAAPGGAAPGR